MSYKNLAKKRAYQRDYYKKWKHTAAGKRHRRASLSWFKTKCGIRYAHGWEEARRLEALKYYGGNPPKCACCGENGLIFLTIDHVNGRKGKRIRKIGGWLKKNKWPAGYQVLCYNCNAAKGQNKKCPHGTDKVNYLYHKDL